MNGVSYKIFATGGSDSVITAIEGTQLARMGNLLELQGKRSPLVYLTFDLQQSIVRLKNTVDNR